MTNLEFSDMALDIIKAVLIIIIVFVLIKGLVGGLENKIDNIKVKEVTDNDNTRFIIKSYNGRCEIIAWLDSGEIIQKCKSLVESKEVEK